MQGTLKALVEFESELDKTKAEVLAEKARIVKDAERLADSSKSSAISKAQAQASERLAKAKAEAERQAESIRRQGLSSLHSFEASVSTRKKKAAETVVMVLLGETK